MFRPAQTLQSMVRCIVFGVAVLMIAGPAMAEKIALVIGNGAYQNTAALRNPENDAGDVAAALEEVGFEVTRLLDLDQISLLKALQDFKNRAVGVDVAIVYYAGHGIEIGRQNYLIPVDAKLVRDTDIPFEAIPLEAAMQAVSAASDLSLVIIDACRNNPFLTTIARTDSTRAISRGLAQVEPAGNTLVAYAAREGTVALDGQGRNSPYASSLVSAIREPGLEIGQLFRQVRDDVLEKTSGVQEPFVYGSLSSKAIFLNPADEEPAATVAAVPNFGADPSEAALELALWNFVAGSDNIEDFRDFLAQHPEGRFAPFAARRIAELEAEAAAPEAPAAADSRLLALSPPDAAAPAPKPAPAVPDNDDTASLDAPEPAPAVVTPLPSEPFVPSRDEVRKVQGSLNALGLDAGRVDGIFGRRTASAIAAFERRRGLPETGELTRELMAELETQLDFLGLVPVDTPPAPVAARPANPPAATPQPTPPRVTQPAAPVTPAPAPKVAAVSTGIYCVFERRTASLREQSCLEIQQVTPTTVVYARMTLLVRDGRQVRRGSETAPRTATGFGSIDVLSSTRIRFRNRFWDKGNALF